MAPSKKTEKKDEPTEFERLCSHIPTEVFVAMLSRASLSDIEARDLAERFKTLKAQV